MSRSWKHIAGFKDKCRGMREIANQHLRHCKAVPSGGAYKKFFERYSISDYSFLNFRRDDWIHYTEKYDRKWPCWKDLNKLSKNNYKEWIK